VIVYLNYILVCIVNKVDHAKRMKNVLSNLWEVSFVCEFVKRCVFSFRPYFLDQDVSGSFINPQPSKLDVQGSFEEPASVHKLQPF
jgi:hypothetical protein